MENQLITTKEDEMTRLDILKEKHVMECHNLLCLSKNLAMTAPKEGREKEWKEAREKVEILEKWIDELEG